MDILCYILCGIVIVLLLIISGAIIYNRVYRRDNSNPLMHLDQYTTDCFLNQLQKMVEVNTIYAVDQQLGSTFSMRADASSEITNEELISLHEKIQIDIVTDMSVPMRTYLFTVFGEEWIRTYVKVYTLSMLINYTKLSIEDIIKAKQ